MSNLIVDFDFIREVMDNLGSTAGNIGEGVLEALADAVMSQIRRLEQIDFDVLDDETIREVISRVHG